MILTGKQCEQYLTANGMGKPAQVGYDLTLKSIKKVKGGIVAVDRTIVCTYEPVENQKNSYHLTPGAYSLTFHQGCKLPANIKASIIHRSSVLRCGGLITSGVYDPGFEVDEMGAILIVFEDLDIEVEARVAQIVMEECYPVEENQLYNGQWQKDKDVK